jgi:hypothetical protein
MQKQVSYRQALNKQDDMAHKIKAIKTGHAFEQYLAWFELGIKMNNPNYPETIADTARKIGEPASALYRLKAFVKDINYSEDKLKELFFAHNEVSIHTMTKAFYGHAGSKGKKNPDDVRAAFTTIINKTKEAVKKNDREVMKYVSEKCNQVMTHNHYSEILVDEGYFKYADCAGCGAGIGEQDHQLIITEDNLTYPMCETCRTNQVPPDYHYIAQLYRVYAKNTENAYNRLLTLR